MGEVRKLHGEDGESGGAALAAQVADLMRHAVRVTDGGRVDLLQLLDAIPACFAYCDRSLRYRFVNRTYESWFDVRREEVLGRTVPDFIGEDAYEVIRPWVERALAGESVQFATSVSLRGTGRRRVLGTYQPQTGNDGRVAGYFAMIQDVSAQFDRQAASRTSRDTVD